MYLGSFINFRMSTVNHRVWCFFLIRLVLTGQCVSNIDKTRLVQEGVKSFTFVSLLLSMKGGGPRVVVSTAAIHARFRGSVPGLGGFKETQMFLPHPRVKVSIVGSLRDREVACSASDRRGSNFESCVWRAVSSQ